MKKERRIDLLVMVFMLIGLSFNARTQNRIIINNAGYLTFGTTGYLVVDNSLANAITTLGNGGGIISEMETAYVIWNVSIAAGSYTVPFCTALPTVVPIPVNYSVTNTGNTSGNGFVIFSTYPTTVPTTQAPWPVVVSCLNFTTPSCSGPDQPYSAVDRFWLIGQGGYSFNSNPAATLELSFLNIEAAAPNTITPANLRAYRYDSNNNDWYGYNSGTSSSGPTVSKVSNIVLPSSNSFYEWTLADVLLPLPVELSSFESKCLENKTHLSWTTDSESNSDYFAVEASVDGIYFEEVERVQAQGNSNSTTNYSYNVSDSRKGNYYRLNQVDVDGVSELSEVIHSNCDPKLLELMVYPNPTDGLFTVDISNNSYGSLLISSPLGKVIRSIKLDAQFSYQIDLSEHAPGIYFVTLFTESNKSTVKIIKK